MPLPPAHSRRAALLAPEAYDVVAAPHTAPVAAAASAPAAPPTRVAPTARAGRKADSVASVPTPLDTAPLIQVETRSRTPVQTAALAAPSAPTAPAGTRKGRAAASPAPRSGRKPAAPGPSKLFVLDTNVLLHDPTSLFRFEEHDIFLPMIVLEELDGHKKGMTEVARNGRQTSRTLDALAAAQGADMA